jgi:hypothetical protein
MASPPSLRFRRRKAMARQDVAASRTWSNHSKVMTLCRGLFIEIWERENVTGCNTFVTGCVTV